MLTVYFITNDVFYRGIRIHIYIVRSRTLQIEMQHKYRIFDHLMIFLLTVFRNIAVKIRHILLELHSKYSTCVATMKEKRTHGQRAHTHSGKKCRTFIDVLILIANINRLDRCATLIHLS